MATNVTTTTNVTTVTTVSKVTTVTITAVKCQMILLISCKSRFFTNPSDQPTDQPKTRLLVSVLGAAKKGTLGNVDWRDNCDNIGWVTWVAVQTEVRIVTDTNNISGSSGCSDII